MAVLMLGAGLQGTLIGVRATLEGFATFVTGVVMAAYFAGYVAGSIVAPSLIHRVGHIRAFAAFSSIASAAVLLQSIFVGAVAWSVLRAVSGACFAGIYVVAESWLNDRAKSSNRGAVLGVYMLVLYSAMGVGQFLLGLADARSATLFIVVAILISTATVPLALTAQPAPDFTLPRRERVRDLLAASPLGVVGVLISGTLSATFFTLGPVYAASLLLDAPAIATFMASGIFAATAAQIPLGRWSDRTDRRTVLLSVATVATLAAFAALALDTGSAAFLALAGLCSGLSLTIYPLAAAHVNDHLTPSQLVAASGTLILVNGAGAIAGPLLVGAAMQAAGPVAYLSCFAALHAAFCGYILWRRTRTAAVSPATKGSFVATQPQATPTGRLGTPGS
jgi:MFS family permease